MSPDHETIKKKLQDNQYEEALQLLLAVNQENYTWETHFLLMRTHNNMDNFSDERLDYGLKALDNLKHDEIIPQIAILTEILTIYYRTGKNYDAMTYVDIGNELIEELDYQQLDNDEKIYVADLLNNIGIIYSNISQHQKAIDTFNERIELLDNIPNKLHLGVTFANLGYVYHGMGKYKNSLKEQLKALEIAKELRDTRMTAIYSNNVANNYAILGDLELAEKTLLEGITCAEEIKMGHLLCYSKAGLAFIYQKRKEYQKSRDLLEEAFDNHHKFKDLFLTVRILFKLIELTIETNQIDDAKEKLELMKEALEQEPEKSRLREYLQLSEALILKESNLFKNKVKAETLLRDFLDMKEVKNPGLQLTAFLHLSNLLLEQLGLDEREEEFEEQEEMILQDLGRILQKIRSVAISEESVDLMIQSLILDAYLKMAEFNTDEAFEYFKQAAELSEFSGIKAIGMELPELEQEVEIKQNLRSFNPDIIESLDTIIHSIPRLKIILLLTHYQKLSFVELREMTELTTGNLGRHCDKLVEAEYIYKGKEIVDDKFLTVYELTPRGILEFNRYSQVLAPHLTV